MHSTIVIFTDFRAGVESLLFTQSSVSGRVIAMERQIRAPEDVQERRKSKRFRLQLAVVFSWRDIQGAVLSGEGWSRNIGSRGIYVGSNVAPPVGSSVEMDVVLPQLGYEIRTAEIYARGRVIRIDRGVHAQICGFAAMNYTAVIREAAEHMLEKKSGKEHGSRVA